MFIVYNGPPERPRNAIFSIKLHLGSLLLGVRGIGDLRVIGEMEEIIQPVRREVRSGPLHWQQDGAHPHTTNANLELLQ
jgi:hypothetical protein